MILDSFLTVHMEVGVLQREPLSLRDGKETHAR